MQAQEFEWNQHCCRKKNKGSTSSLRLHLVTKLPAIFTSSQISTEDNTPQRIELVDGKTNERVMNGSLSSIKLKIVILDGDFRSDEGEDWTEKEFNYNIVCERDGRRPLITGELNVILQGGIGCLRNLIITDSSSWMRSREMSSSCSKGFCRNKNK